MRQLDLAISLNPNESNVYLWQGIGLSTLGYIDQAIVVLKQAETIDPAFINLQNWLVNLYLAKGDVASAMRHLDILLKLDPDFPMNDFGDPALHDGDLDLAEADAREFMIDVPGGDRLVEVYFAALREPNQRETAIAANCSSFESRAGKTRRFYGYSDWGQSMTRWRHLATTRSLGRGLRCDAKQSRRYLVRCQHRKIWRTPAMVAVLRRNRPGRLLA